MSPRFLRWSTAAGLAMALLGAPGCSITPADLDAARRIEGVRSEVPVEGRAEVELASLGRITLEPGPAVAAKAGGEVGPAGGEDVRVNVDRVDDGAPLREYSKLDSPRRAD